MHKILNLAVMIYFLSGTLYVTDIFKKFQPILLLFSFSIIILIYMLSGKKKYYVTKKDLLYFLFIAFMLLSALLNHDLKNFFGSVCMLLTYIVIGRLLPQLFFLNPYKIYYNITFSHFILFLISIMLYGISFKSYQGIFGNPNSLGGIATTLFTISLGLLTFKIKNYLLGDTIKSQKIYLDLFLLFFWGFFIVISSSRTSFLTMIILLICSIIYIIKKIKFYKFKIKRITYKRTMIIFLILCVLIVILNNIFSLDELIQSSILNKFENKSGDITDGRSERWIIVLKEISFLGYGSKHYKFGAHNTFISILGQYGLLSMLSFIIFLLFTFKKSLKYSNLLIFDSIIPLLSIISFIALSLAESMMLKTSMLLVYFCLGTMNMKK